MTYFYHLGLSLLKISHPFKLVSVVGNPRVRTPEHLWVHFIYKPQQKAYPGACTEKALRSGVAVQAVTEERGFREVQLPGLHWDPRAASVGNSVEQNMRCLLDAMVKCRPKAQAWLPVGDMVVETLEGGAQLENRGHRHCAVTIL